MRVRIVREQDLAAGKERQLRDLLVATFPHHATLFGVQSFWGSVPEWRLWLEDEDGATRAHLEFGARRIIVGPSEFDIVGVGAVAVHPDSQRRGLGRRLFAELRAFLRDRLPVDFAFLECREAIVPFYVAAGLRRFDQTVWCFDPDARQWQESIGPKMVLPVRRPIDDWPARGRIDLRGMPW
jgi:GNAT superfamily N-acetyltransferase